MPEATKFDSTDKGTLRPNAEPIMKPGTHFEPMQLRDRHFEITLPETSSPDDPITLFLLYYNSRIIETIVQYTNSYAPSQFGPLQERSRAAEWFPTSAGEIYIYLAIRVYSTLFEEDEIANYWDTREGTPNHYISEYMARDRF
jgi:hypothetical protein